MVYIYNKNTKFKELLNINIYYYIFKIKEIPPNLKKLKIPNKNKTTTAKYKYGFIRGVTYERYLSLMINANKAVANRIYKTVSIKHWIFSFLIRYTSLNQ